jgi:hypothetical protein
MRGKLFVEFTPAEVAARLVEARNSWFRTPGAELLEHELGADGDA